MGKLTIVIILSVVQLFAATHAQAEGQQWLVDYILKMRAILDPEIVTNCFNTYLPVFRQINDDFMEAYQKCSADANDRTSDLEVAALTRRRQVETAGEGMCIAVKGCNDLEDALDFFKCYSEQSGNASRDIYELTHNASNFARDIREQYLISDAEKSKCQNASHRVHVEDTARTYKDLDRCLRGGGSSTEAPSSTEATSQTTEETTGTSDPAGTTTESPGTLPPYEPDDPNDPREYKFDRNLKVLPQLRKFYGLGHGG